MSPSRSQAWRGAPNIPDDGDWSFMAYLLKGVHAKRDEAVRRIASQGEHHQVPHRPEMEVNTQGETLIMSDEELEQHQNNLEILRDAISSGDPVDNDIATAAFMSWCAIDAAAGVALRDMYANIDALRVQLAQFHFSGVTGGTA